MSSDGEDGDLAWESSDSPHLGGGALALLPPSDNHVPVSSRGALGEDGEDDEEEEEVGEEEHHVEEGEGEEGVKGGRGRGRGTREESGAESEGGEDANHHGGEVSSTNGGVDVLWTSSGGVTLMGTDEHGCLH